VATPLKLRDQIIGVLGVHDENPDRQWTEDELALIEAVSEQISMAIENARLFEHTQRDAWRNRIISETTAHVWASAEMEEVMKAAVAQLGDKLRASEVVIQLGTEANLVKEQGDER
jgi:GAF domain-containing protein